MQDQITLLKAVARKSGILYLIIGIGTLYGLVYLPAVKGKNILSREFLYASAIFSNMICAVAALFLAVTLDKLVKQLKEFHNKALIAFIILQVVLYGIIELTRAYELIKIRSGPISATGQTSAVEMAFLYQQYIIKGRMIYEIFTGVCLIPFAVLIFQSWCIPRILAVLLLVAVSGLAVDIFVYLFFSPSRTIIQVVSLTLGCIAQAPVILWFILIGIRDHISIQVISVSDRKDDERAFIRANEF